MKKYIFTLALTLFSTINLLAQVGINTDNSDPDASAMLDIKSTTKGILIPRMNMAQRAGIANPVKGLLVFVTNDDSFYYYDGSDWELLGSDDLGDHIATENIRLSGYRLTNDGGNGDGIRILNNGDVGVGLESSILPEARLHVGTISSSELAYALRLDNRNNSVGSAVGLQFGKDNNGDGKGAIVYETTAGWGRGSMHFLQNAEVNGNEADLDDKVMTIQNDGKVGIGLSDPATKTGSRWHRHRYSLRGKRLWFNQYRWR